MKRTTCGLTLRAAAMVACAVAVGCGGAPEAPPATGSAAGPTTAVKTSEIKGGTLNPGDPNVFMLLIEYSDGAYICTSTLIGRRTLLTAAHCVDTVANKPPTRIRAHNLPEIPPRDSASWWEAETHVIHPGWKGFQLEDTADVALVKLRDAPPVKPKSWNRRQLTPYLGAQIRAVGYGIVDSGGSGSGIKRQISMLLRGLDRNNLMTGDPGQGGICQGDSGGPSFFTFPDGVERHVGIHSYGSSEGGCEDGTDVRSDFYRSFIEEHLTAWETPTCDGDGACAEGCMPADADCACVANDVCEPTCADPSRDPDCQQACAENGVCGTACTTADPDCNGPFVGCDVPEDCATRVCVSDPQSFGTYCSQTCAAPADCPSGFECSEGACKHVQLPTAGPGEPCTAGQTYCTDGLACTGPEGEQTTCQKQCFTAIACTSLCNAGQNGISYCTPLLGEQPGGDDEEPGCGCTSVAGAPLALAGLLTLTWRLRRRRAVRHPSTAS